MKRVLGFGLILLLLTACSPEKRVARIVAKYHLPTVTEYVTDTVILPERVRTDTVVMHAAPVVIEDSVLVVEIVPVNDTVFVVNTKIKADTIIKSVPVTKYVVESKPDKRKPLVVFLFVACLCVVALAGVGVVKILKM